MTSMIMAMIDSLLNDWRTEYLSRLSPQHRNIKVRLGEFLDRFEDVEELRDDEIEYVKAVHHRITIDGDKWSETIRKNNEKFRGIVAPRGKGWVDGQLVEYRRTIKNEENLDKD